MKLDAVTNNPNKAQILVLKSILASKVATQKEGRLYPSHHSPDEQSAADQKKYNLSCKIYGLEIAINYLYGSKFERSGFHFMYDKKLKTDGTKETLDAYSLLKSRWFKQYEAISYAAEVLGMIRPKLINSLIEREAIG